MTLRQPTFAGGLCTTTNDLRLMQAGIVCSEGVGAFDQMLVTATDPVSGQVTVSAGHAFVADDSGGDAGGMYHAYNDDAVELDVPLNSSGSDRTDVVWLQICDTEYGGVSGATFIYDDNNPTATPPGDGCAYYLLATLVIPNGAGDGGTNVSGTPTTWGDTDSMVTDERSEYTMCGSKPYVAISGDATNDIPDAAYHNYFDDNYTVDHIDAAFFTVTDESGHPKVTALQAGEYEVNAGGGFLSIGTVGSARAFVILTDNTNLPNAAPNGTRIAENRVNALPTFYATPTRGGKWYPAGTTFKFAAFHDSGDTAENVPAGHFTVRKIG
jgi:hypothetical protein